MFTIKSEDQIFQIFEDCLRGGLINQSDANYSTNNKNLVLLVCPMDNYFELYSRGHLLIRMNYFEDNKTWREATVENQYKSRLGIHYQRYIKVYKRVKEEKGIRVS